MSQNFSEIVKLCTEYSDRLRSDILAKNPSISVEAYQELFWPPWVEKFNMLIEKLKDTTPRAELEHLHSQLMRIGLDFLMMQGDSRENKGFPGAGPTL